MKIKTIVDQGCTDMRKTLGLSTAFAIAVLSLLSGGQSAWAQRHPPLEYKGGPVLDKFKIYSLYWGQWTPAQIKAQQDYLSGLAAYISGVGSPKGEEPMLRQYGVNEASVTGYSKANPKAVKSLSRDDIVDIIKNNAGKLPAFDAHTLIIVFLGTGSSLTFGPGRGYHHSESKTAFWAAVPQNAKPTLAAVTSHEVFEAATDPAFDNSKGWISQDGLEACDKCNKEQAKYPFITLYFGQISGAADNTQGGTCSKTGYIPTQTKPTIAVNNVTNECGGTLYVSGRGFTAGEQVRLTVKNAPGLKSPQKIGAVGTVNKQGKVSIQIGYSTNPYSGLPGCGKGSTATVVLTITATDESGHEASTQIYLRNCGITWGACPA